MTQPMYELAVVTLIAIAAALSPQMPTYIEAVRLRRLEIPYKSSIAEQRS